MFAVAPLTHSPLWEFLCLFVLTVWFWSFQCSSLVFHNSAYINQHASLVLLFKLCSLFLPPCVTSLFVVGHPWRSPITAVFKEQWDTCFCISSGESVGSARTKLNTVCLFITSINQFILFFLGWITRRKNIWNIKCFFGLCSYSSITAVYLDTVCNKYF